MSRTALSSLLLSMSFWLPTDMLARQPPFKCWPTTLRCAAGRVGTIVHLSSASDSSRQHPPRLILRSTDLHRSGGTEQIGRQQVTAASTSKFDLPTNTPKDFESRSLGSRSRGPTRENSISFKPGQGIERGARDTYQVIAEGVPKLSQRKGSESVKIQLFNCVSFGCDLARLLQPKRIPVHISPQVDNSSL